MVSKQLEALRLADLLEDSHLLFHHRSAAELRRLYEENVQMGEQRDELLDALATCRANFRRYEEETLKMAQAEDEERASLRTQRDELLEALRSVWLWMDDQADGQSKGGHATFDLMLLREQRDTAREAIAKATGETK